MNFCFVIDNKLSASSQPGKNKRLSFYLELYKENNERKKHLKTLKYIIKEDARAGSARTERTRYLAGISSLTVCAIGKDDVAVLNVSPSNCFKSDVSL